MQTPAHPPAIGYNPLMPITYDLHSHSLVSDGVLTPSELVHEAAGAGVDVLALTDHDDTGGVQEARAAAKGCGITLIPGVEVSVTWKGATLHVVGLAVNPEAPELAAGLEGLRAFRDWRAGEMSRRLEKAGVAGALEGARAFVHGRILSRNHFAQFLVQAGHVDDHKEAFKRYLRHNRPGFVPGQWASLEQAVSWIRAAGGQAVLAHPARYGLTATKLRRLLGEFVEHGGDGLEVVSGSHNRDETHYMARLAEHFGLWGSAGSDFHGPERSWAQLGRLPPLPGGCRPLWEHPEWPGRAAIAS